LCSAMWLSRRDRGWFCRCQASGWNPGDSSWGALVLRMQRFWCNDFSVLGKQDSSLHQLCLLAIDRRGLAVTGLSNVTPQVEEDVHQNEEHSKRISFLARK
jgi:hypothetical protein